MPANEALMARAEELGADREPFVHATVVRARHPTSAHAGDVALVLSDGAIEGFVGGACVESSVRKYSLQVLSTGEPLLLKVAPGEPSQHEKEGAVEVSNPCLSGGEIEIFLDPRIPAPRVTVVGRTPVAYALEAIGTTLGMDVRLTDGGAPAPHDDDAALIVASHGRDEESALEAALMADVPYVALVASATRGAAVVASLNVDDDRRSRVHSPAGLQFGAATPAEIALSILAELVSERASQRAHRVATPHIAPAATAIDPVCGMSVVLDSSSLHAEIGTGTEYFCSKGCRAAFLSAPERYASTS